MFQTIEKFFQKQIAMPWKKWLMLAAPVLAGLLGGLLHFPINVLIYSIIAGALIALATMYFSGQRLADILVRYPLLLALGFLATGEITPALLRANLPYVIILFVAYALAIVISSIGMVFENQDEEDRQQAGK